MKPRVLILVILALVIAIGTARLAKSWLASQRAALASQEMAPKDASTYVLVAAKDLPMGSFVRPEDLRWQAWPNVELNANYLRKGKDDPKALVGAVVRGLIAAGEPVTNGRVIKPGERGFLAAVLSPGMRAVAVPVTPTSGVGGLIFPGDHVDVILSHSIKVSPDPNQPPRTASETVLSNLRVVGVDQSTDDKDGKPVLAKTVTFEVTPKQAEAIEVASELGKLSLSLRSLAHDGDVTADGTAQPALVTHTWDSDVSPLLRPHATPHEAPIAPVVTVLRGSSSSTVTTAAPAAPAAGPAPAPGPAPGAPPTITRPPLPSMSGLGSVVVPGMAL
ncbi:MAG TPA: Flp pilus assembly protein CpaB [Alphaproteobacteria bacterium]|nr:Flp pilus assembly protein CpaB [Alphaproteobacteria bacterium]